MEPHALPDLPYRAPAWLPGGHLQTVYGALITPCPGVIYRRERWDTPEGDFIDLDWAQTRDEAPLIVLFHGLEGGSRSRYALALMAAVKQHGWAGVVVHFRGCSGESNRLPRAYHSGDSAEIDWVLRRLKLARPTQPVYAVGVSLGGNALLKWLGEQREAAREVVSSVVAISAPMDLAAAGDRLAHGFNRAYTRAFLSTLKKKSLVKLKRYPGLFDAKAMLNSCTLREFDDHVTAPLHGFRDTDDYWTRASSKPGLIHIEVPTLVINARNDPFLPAAALPSRSQVSPSVRLEYPDQGGHVGFVSGRFPGRLDWLPRRALGFFGA